MAVENQIIIIAIGMLFGYIIQTGDKGVGIKLFANMVYLACGASLMYYSVVVASDAYVGSAIGLTIILGSIIKSIVDLMPHKST